jgi:uroporphyrin-3 C-methyltransferase
MTEQDNISAHERIEAQAQKLRATKPSFFAKTALVLVLFTLCLVTWLWLGTRYRFSELEQTLTQRLEQYDGRNHESSALAKHAEENTVQFSARIALLEQKLAESRNQQEALQTLYLELANNREERLIAEVEQLLIIANQQLQLAGNIKPALLAMQTADTRLLQLDSPQIIPLRKAVAKDILRLQTLPTVDIVGMSLRLENLTENINELPLISERHPKTSDTPMPDWNSSPWHRLAQEVWQDMKHMVRIERTDRAEPPLLPPEQSYFLRENLKLHLLTARIALLQHDEASYRADLGAAETWLKRHFDVHDPATNSVLASLAQLSASGISIQTPDISESLSLVSKYKLTLERGKQ